MISSSIGSVFSNSTQDAAALELDRAPLASRRFGHSGLLRFGSWLLLLCLSFSLGAADNRIDFPVRINGQVMRFAFDTGAGVETTLWSEVANMIGLKSKVQSTEPIPTGSVAFAISDSIELEFLGHRFPDAHVAIVNSPDYWKWEVQGLIGWPAVRDNIWQIDLGRKGFGVLDHVPAEAEGWLKYRVAKKDILTLEIPQSDGTIGLLSIDTGDTGSVSLAPRLWADWKSTHPESPIVFQASEMLETGVAALEATAATQWSLGDLTLTNVILQEAHPSDIAAMGPNYLATFGYDALRKLTLIVDAMNGWAYLRPHDDAPALGSYNRLGAAFIPASPQDKNTLVARVTPGSPASAAGLRDGDRLLKLNGIAIEHWRKRPGAWSPATFFEQAPGTRLDLVVSRDGKSVSAHPVLQSILAPQNVPLPPTFDSSLPLYFHFVPPLASLVRRGAAAGIQTGPIVLAGGPGVMQKGDTVTALITCVDDDKLQQWLVLFACNDLKPEEEKAKRILPAFYTSSGRELHFDPVPAAVAIHVVGPLDQNGKGKTVRDEWSGAIVTREFLTMGFDSTALAMRKLDAVAGGQFSFNTQPFPEKEIAMNRSRLEAGGLVEKDERAFAGGVLAIGDFFRIAAQTPGVRDVLHEMIDISWKDFLRNPQVNINIQPPVEDLAPGFWGLPAGEPCHTFSFRVDLNGVPRLMCRVATTQALRPLQTVAGVIGIAASRVDGSGPHVMVRVISAHFAENIAAK